MEVDTLDLANTELVEYELRKLGATDATIQAAQALQEELDAHEAIAAIEKENAEIFEQSAELQEKASESVAKRWEDTGQQMGAAFGQAISEGNSFRDILGQIEQDLIRFASQKLMEQAFGAGGPGGFGGGFLEGLLGSFSGFFQRGGRIPPGGFGVVGERGPELAFGGAGGTNISPTINVNVNAPMGGQGGGSDMQLAARIGEQVSRALKRNR